jgi:hypothetical protein
MSRVALMAISTTVVAAGAVALEGCGGDTASPGPIADAAADAKDATGADTGLDTGAMPVYGAPAMDAGPRLDGGPMALYGGPPVMDAGTDGGAIGALYGGPPVSTDGGKDSG